MRVTLARSAQLSQDLWKWYREIPEIHYSISRNARIAGYARLFPTKRNVDGEHVRIDSSDQKLTTMDREALKIVADIVSPYGGLPGLIERFYALRKVPADSWLIADRNDGGFYGYHFLSPGELSTSNQSEIDGTPWFETPTTEDDNFQLWWRRARNANSTQNDLFEKVARKDVLGRVWAPHPEFIDEPDSALSAVSFECDLLYQSTRLLMAKIKQRLVMGGMMFIPQGIRHANPVGDKTGEADLLKTLAMALTANVKSLDEAGALAPILLEGDPALGEKIRWLQADQDIWETDIAIRQELIGRVMFGLDNQKNATSGEAMSHMQSWQAADDERRIAVMPDIRAMTHPLAKLILIPKLLEKFPDREAEVALYGVGATLDDAATKTNQAEDARQAHDRLLLKRSASNRKQGFEDDDLLDEESDEYVRRAGLKAGDPYLSVYGTSHVDKIDWDKVGKRTNRGQEPERQGDEPEAGPGVGDPGSPNPNDRDTDTPRTQRPA